MTKPPVLLPPLFADWFASRGWKPLPFQRQAWRHYLAGESGLIHTPTGSGKTLAAFGGPLLEALAESPALVNGKRNAPRPLRVIWITPLRALASDTTRALTETAQAVGLPWTVAQRTGDASARDKRLAREVLDFTSRGIPYYSLDDQHFQSWVAQAVSLWQKAQRVEPVPA